MNQKITNSNSLPPEVIRAKIKEADLYVSHGLFDQAREIYQSLLRHFQSQMESTTTPGEQTNRVAQAGVKILQDRLREIDRQFDAFYERPKPSEPSQGAEADLDKESIFNAAVALKEIGLYDEAIQEFKRAAKLRYNVSECYEKIGDSLIRKGDFLQGIKVLRTLLQSKDISPTQRTTILEKIASAYESAGDKNNALETYQELVNEVKTHTSAFEKVDQLTRDLKRFRLSIALVTEHPRIFLIISLLIAFIFISFAPFIKTVDNVDYFTLEDDPDVKFYDEFKEVFGNDEFFVIAFEKNDIFTERNLTLLKNITEDLENIEEIEEVTSLANVDDMIGGPDYFEVRRFLEDIPDDKNKLENIKKQAINNALYLKNLISPDARTAAIIIQVYDRPEDESYRKRLINKTHRIIDHYRNEVGTFYLAGGTTTNLSLSQYMKKDVATFIPITYVLITFAIWLVFRNLKLTLLAITNISLCVGSTMGLFGLTGITLNNVTSIIPSLVMALALCDTVHIFSHMDKRVLEKFPDKRKALANVLKKVVLPSFLTTLTTAIGFLSLAVSKIPPIKEFAYIASAGMLFEFVYSFFLLPPLILFFAPERVYQEYHARRGMTLFLRRINGLVQRHNRMIAMATCIVVLAAIWFTINLRVETNLIEFFKKSSPLRTSIAFVEEKLGGVDSLDISLKAQEEDAFQEPENLMVIDTIQQYVKSLKGIDVTISFVDFLKDMNESFHDENPRYYTIPETRDMVSQYLLLYDSEDIEDVINSTYDHARISVRISEHSSAGQKKLINEIQKYIAKMSHPGLDIRVTGSAVNLVNTNDALVKGQVYSLSLAAGVISVIMLLVLRSIAIGFLSLIPNIFPIVFNFGIMGAAGIPLDTGTALIAAVALGIAVDDTIHFLSEYNKQRAQKVPIPKSLERVIFTKGRAIISSSLILCIGFGVLVLSRFVPTGNFGMLCAIIMITAVIGDIVVLPSIILLKRQGFFTAKGAKERKDEISKPLIRTQIRPGVPLRS